MSFNDISTYLKQFSRDIKVHGLPRWLGSRESAYNAGGTGNIGSISGLGNALRRKWLHTAVFFSGETHGQRSLTGYNPWGHKESDVTE